MTNSDSLNAAGYFTIEVIRDGKNGPEILSRETVPNLIVNTGKRQIWRMCCGTTPLNAKNFKMMRIGTSAAAATSGSTNVVSPVASTIKTCDSFSLLVGTRTMRFIYSYASGGGSISAADISEVTILNQRTTPGGSALCRSTFTPVTKTTADKLKITYQCRIT